METDSRDRAIEALDDALQDALDDGDSNLVAAVALDFIAAALHRDGDDARAIRKALGLTRHSQTLHPIGHGREYRVVSEWREL